MAKTEERTVVERGTELNQQQRPLGIVSATTLVVASMIGVGVYTTSGYSLAALGSPALVIAAWGVAGIIAICGAIGYSSLAVKFSESGGEYLFLSRSLHPVAGLMAGWISFLAGFTGAIAFAALGLEEYLVPIIGIQLPDRSIAIGAVLSCATLHTLGVSGAARIQDAIVVLKLIMIAAIIWVSLAAIDRWSAEPAVIAKSYLPLAFVGQLVWISVSYAGFNAAVYVASEVNDPERNVPRAMVGGTIVVTLVYVVLNAIFVLAAAPSVITNLDRISQVAATAAAAVGGDSFEIFVRVVIVTSLASSVSALVMTGPRVYAKMADDGFFPAWFRFDNRPPIAAIWFQAIAAIVVISISTLSQLLGYLGLTLSVCSALTVGMVFVLRYQGKIARLPYWGIPAAFYVLATLALAVLFAIDQPRQTIGVAMTILIGIALYPLVGHRPQSKDVA